VKIYTSHAFDCTGHLNGSRAVVNVKCTIIAYGAFMQMQNGYNSKSNNELVKSNKNPNVYL
jgi:hypothetical protein